MNKNGIVLWESSRAVCVATGIKRPTANRRTGNMIQLWLLAKQMDPVKAIVTGADSLVCGNCSLRGNLGKDRTCYVNIGQAPLVVYRAYKAGSYGKWDGDTSVFRRRRVRLGAYGDPTLLPIPIIESITVASSGWTGYTHQWRNPLFSGYRRYVMASCDSAEDQIEATRDGWRTFRVVAKGSALFPDEIACPNETHKVQCNKCGLCNGITSQAKNIAINVHGNGAVNFGG